MEENRDATHKGNRFHIYYNMFIKVATMQPNPAISLKTENKLFKKMEISNSVSKRNPQET